MPLTTSLFKLFLRPLPLLLAALLSVMACEENVDDEDPEYNNWQARNEAFFQQKMDTAKAAIKAAQTEYGADWEAHCPYRILRNYAISDTLGGTLADSICVEIVESGSGSVVPYYTDSVRLSSTRRLMPTDKYPAGKLVDHTGYTVYDEDIFNDVSSSPVLRAVSALTKGETTALMRMHVGDRWRITMHTNMAYGSSTAQTAIPAYSALVSEIKLRAIYRRGTDIPDWK